MWFTIYLAKGKGLVDESMDESKIVFHNQNNIKSCNNQVPYRTSPIFPISEKSFLDADGRYFIVFYNYPNSYQIIAKLKARAQSDLVSRLWFNVGLSSLVLITKDETHEKQIKDLIDIKPNSKEVWEVENEIVVNHFYELKDPVELECDRLTMFDYSSLATVDRAIIDEFVSSIDLIIPKIAIHIPEEIESYYHIISTVNEMIHELLYIKGKTTDLPQTLLEFENPGDLSDDMKEVVYNQCIERIIQINSALSYISTQSLSGAVPIFERRSLIRRHSLLGIGTAIFSLSRIAKTIEAAFAQINLEKIILDRMDDDQSKILTGFEDIVSYNSTQWSYNSINNWQDKVPPNEEKNFKLPYFSGRLGFRETEFTISAAIHCISSGASLDWPLITMTHEMTHSHVRRIMSLIFKGGPGKGPVEVKGLFYDKFKSHVFGHLDRLTLLDSIRNVFFTYCCLTFNHGSLSRKPIDGTIEISQKMGKLIRKKFYLLSKGDLWDRFEHEFRNVNEIFAHVLDLHYFYLSNVRNYIPLIWRSWSSVPGVGQDLRQYILRSLLIISTRFDTAPYKRFESSVEEFLDIIEAYKETTMNLSIINGIVQFLESEDQKSSLFLPFYASLIIADLANNVFVSGKVRSSLLVDGNIVPVISDESDDEFIYNLPDGFHDTLINSPATYLFDRNKKRLDNPIPDEILESETAVQFLACSSNIRT